MRADHGVVATGDQGGHVQGRADDFPAAPSGSLAAHRAAVAIDRDHADEGGAGLATELAELGQTAEQGAGRLDSGARNACEQRFLFEPARGQLDQSVEIVVNRVELSFQHAQHGFDAGRDFRCDGLGQAIALGRVQFEDLPTACEQIDQRRRQGVGQRTQRGIDAGAEACQHGCVDRIGLGEYADGAGEVADLPGIDDDDRQARRGQRRDNGALVDNRRWIRARSGVAPVPEAGRSRRHAPSHRCRTKREAFPQPAGWRHPTELR